MKSSIKHIIQITIISMLLVFAMIYPFLPGDYEVIAMPLSIIIQVAGWISLPLVVVGILWCVMPRHKNRWAITAYIIGIGIALIILLLGILSVGYLFALALLIVLGYFFYLSFGRLNKLRKNEIAGFRPTALYLLVFPLVVIIAQLLLQAPLTKWSRNRTIANATTMINDIENYKRQYGSYPISLQAQWKDYYPNTVGIEKYFYAPQGRSYNLQFEQPRFMFDRFGTREWVVFNPLNEHSSYSHASWHLMISPQQVMRNQGWYAYGNTEYPYWKYFLFD